MASSMCVERGQDRIVKLRQRALESVSGKHVVKRRLSKYPKLVEKRLPYFSKEGVHET